MKNLPKLVTIAAASLAMLVLAGCPKKPNRAAVDQTMPSGPVGPTAITPIDLGTLEPGSGLEPRNLPAGVIDEGAYFRGMMESVYFEFDRSAVAQRERSKVDAAATWMKANPDKRVILEGHCDWRGTAEYNLGLGDRRASAVKKFLESLGIDSSRLEIISKGDIDAKEGAQEADMSKDRRVDFLVLK